MSILALHDSRWSALGSSHVRLDGRLVAREHISSATTQSMFELLTSHFDGVRSSTFEADLRQKNWVILLEDQEGHLRGFSTLLVYTTESPGVPVTVVYSGDTIVERTWWGSPALARTWIRSVRALAASRSGQDLYWLLLTSGYRTYRFLPVFFRTFYPRHDATTPAASQMLIDTLATERFGSLYSPLEGIVRFEHPQVLAPDVLAVPPGRVLDEHVRFFLTRNPGYTVGDELVCLTRIHDSNLTRAGRRMSGGAN